LDNEHTKECKGNGATRFFSYFTEVDQGTF